MRVTEFSKSLLSDCNMPLITIYKKPKDFPNHYVARLFDLDNPTKYFIIDSSYEDLISLIPSRMTKLNRCSDDDSVIVETWI